MLHYLPHVELKIDIPSPLQIMLLFFKHFSEAKAPWTQLFKSGLALVNLGLKL